MLTTLARPLPSTPWIMDKNCSSLRDSLLALFANELEVTAFEAGCIITLPLKTVDDRYIDVFVEPVKDSLFTYVHDGGKSTAELFAQGVHLTDKQTSVLKGVAQRYGAVFQDGRFQIACPSPAVVQSAILAVGQCAVLSMVEIVSHEAVVEDELLSVRVGRSLHSWQPEHVAHPLEVQTITAPPL